MKLTYWFSEHINCEKLNLREKTKKVILEKIKKSGPENYKKPERVTVNYDSGFDLMKMCLSEERKFWGVIR